MLETCRCIQLSGNPDNLYNNANGGIKTLKVYEFESVQVHQRARWDIEQTMGKSWGKSGDRHVGGHAHGRCWRAARVCVCMGMYDGMIFGHISNVNGHMPRGTTRWPGPWLATVAIARVRIYDPSQRPVILHSKLAQRVLVLDARPFAATRAHCGPRRVCRARMRGDRRPRLRLLTALVVLMPPPPPWSPVAGRPSALAYRSLSSANVPSSCPRWQSDSSCTTRTTRPGPAVQA